MTTVLEQIGKSLSTLQEVPHDRLALHLLDTLGALLAGTGTEEGALLARFGAAPVIGQASFDAIARLAATIRLTEIDDIHMRSCTTPSAVIVPVALTLAAASGEKRATVFAASLAAGYEAMTRLGAAVAGPRILYRGIWPSYLTAPFAAAAVTARLLGLDAGKTADALAIALTMMSGAPGGHQPSASPRWLLLGQAARAGAFAGFAASQGYGGDRTLLDGDWLRRTHGIDGDNALLLDRTASAVGALSLKRYCAAKQTIAAIDGFRALLADGITPAEITHLRVAVPSAYAGMINHRNIASRVGRITSLAYQLALAAFRPDLLDDIAKPDVSGEAAIAGLMARVEVVADAALEPYYPARWPAHVEIVLADGSNRSTLVLDATGDPACALDADTVTRKFHRLADPVLGRKRAEAMAEAALEAAERDEALDELCAVWARWDQLSAGSPCR